MGSKALETSEYIVDMVAPIFNKNGYSATSMRDITEATGLTKGAIYGNFRNKEELAIAAFKKSSRHVLSAIGQYQEHIDSPIKKLYCITEFYRDYYDFIAQYGGCPILNIGVDANNQNTGLIVKVKEVILKIEQSIIDLLESGKVQGEIKNEIDSKKYAKRLFVMIEGAVFMAFTMKDKSYLLETMDLVDYMITNELRA